MKILTWLRTGAGLESPPSERDLFVAMHTCAWRATHPTKGTRIGGSPHLQWERRWNVLREHIIARNLGLAYWIARRFISRSLDDDELLSEAMFGLLRAVDHFDPRRGFRFGTYAWNVILRTLLRREKREARYRKVFPVRHEPSLESSKPQPRSERDLYVERLRYAIKNNLGDLTHVEAEVLAGRFPMNEDVQMTLQQIGVEFGLSKERVRQIQNRAVQKLRDALAADPLLQPARPAATRASQPVSQ